MAFVNTIAIPAWIVLCAIIRLPSTLANPYVIADDRVRNLDITPVLGRGYSIMTNSFQTTCLVVEETTIPSFNYDYSFFDFTRSVDFNTDLGSKLSDAFVYPELKKEFDASYNAQSSGSVTTFYIIAIMRVERYYASVKEESTKLSDQAMALLETQDYIGFFKACGPNYVRGIRRKQEVSTMYKFQSTSVDTAYNFAKSLQRTEKTDGGGETNTQFSGISNSLEIKIVGYGLGLTDEGSETLIATTLKDVMAVMKFAYNSMAKNKNSVHIGMIYGIEVLPYVENPVFQLAARVTDDTIEIPLARSLIPRAFRISNSADMNFVEAERSLFKCKTPGLVIDKFGYCCENSQLYDFVIGQYVVPEGDQGLAQLGCRPIRPLERAVMKDTLATNGEFVARLDRALRYKMNVLSTVEKCLSTINGYPSRLNRYYLSSKSDIFNVGLVTEGITVYEMKKALDPFGNYAVIQHLGYEIDEFIEMYYARCLGALFGATASVRSENDPSYLMAYPWYTHKECTHMSCMVSGMRWDRDNGGCTPGILSGKGATRYEDSDSSSIGQCNIDADSSGSLQCKVSATTLNQFVDQSSQCWGAAEAATESTGLSIELYLTNYCMPTLSGVAMGEDDFIQNILNKIEGCGTEGFETPAPSLSPSSSPTSSSNSGSRRLSSRTRPLSGTEAHNRRREKELERRSRRR